MYQNILKENSLFKLKGNKKPINQTAKNVLSKLHSKIVDKIDAIENQYDDNELHKIRIAFKKLRYLLEEFELIFGEEKIAKIIQKGKKLQTILGDYNDLINESALLQEFLVSHLKDLPGTKELEEKYSKKSSKQIKHLRGSALQKLHKFKEKPFKL